MYKKKKGVTLIESIAYISIIILITTLLPISIKMIKNTKNIVIINDEIGEIHSFLMLSKYLSRNEKRTGNIYYKKENNSFTYNNNKSVRNLLLENINVYDINSRNGTIDIDSSGKITSACTITLEDESKKKYKITIGVGSELIEIKK